MVRVSFTGVLKFNTLVHKVFPPLCRAATRSGPKQKQKGCIGQGVNQLLFHPRFFVPNLQIAERLIRRTPCPPNLNCMLGPSGPPIHPRGETAAANTAPFSAENGKHAVVWVLSWHTLSSRAGLHSSDSESRVITLIHFLSDAGHGHFNLSAASCRRPRQENPTRDRSTCETNFGLSKRSDTKTL
jgi:hypothetical protein